MYQVKCMFKNMKKLFALLLALTMVFSLCVGCSKADGDGDSSDYMSLSPKEHLIALESAWLANLQPNTNAGGGLPSMGIDMSADVRLGDGLKGMFASGTPGAAILDQVSSVSIDYLMIMDGNMYQLGLGAGVNGVELAAAEVVMDMANYVLWVSLPGLSDQDVKIDLGAVMESQGVAGMMPAAPDLSQLSIDPELVIGLIKDYYTLVLNGIEDVEREETSLKCSGVKQDAIKLSVKLTAEDLSNILLDVLKKAKDDDRIETLLDSLMDIMGDTLASAGGVMPEDLVGQLDDGIEVLIDSIENATFDDGDYINFKVYTDKKNAVIGREASVYTQGSKVATVEYASVSDGDDFAVELSFEMDQMGFAFSGDGSISDGKRSGDFAISMTTAGQEMDLVTFELKDADDKGGELKIEPTAELLSMILGGGAGYLDVALEIKWDEQKASFDVLMNDMLLVGLDIKAEIMDNASVTAPSGVPELDSLEEMTQWAQGINVQKLLERLEEAGITDLPIFGK